ncbi:MAG: PEP-CTERM sorting domain-containing protein [Pirellulales bacterium]
MRYLRAICLSAALVCTAAVPAQAIITIHAGNHVMLPNTPGQVIDIMITSDSGDEISGLDLYLMINGADANAYDPSTPRITAIDVTGPGTVFGAVPSTTFPYGDPWDVANGTSYGQNVAYGAAPNATSGPSADAPANGVLAHVTVDTTGVFGGIYPLSLTDPFIFGPTLLSKVTGPLVLGEDYVLVDGMLGSIPEPSSLVLAALGAAGVAVVSLRRRPALRRRRRAYRPRPLE